VRLARFSTIIADAECCHAMKYDGARKDNFMFSMKQASSYCETAFPVWLLGFVSLSKAAVVIEQLSASPHNSHLPTPPSLITPLRFSLPYHPPPAPCHL